ncbi:MAG TPA: M1 family aminopeptidase, partial [Bryobacteraceae bacterium]|nr:M1 family aminopeptidase [Bryobacteraceae bacterium]
HLAIELRAHAAKLIGHEDIKLVLRRVPADPLPLDFRDLTAAGGITEGLVSKVRINAAPSASEQANGHILLPPALLHAGLNRIELDFESAIAESNRAVTRTIDPVDSNEYIYTLFVPMDASLAFPCFDQPDLKGRFTLEATVPATWTVISNTSGKGNGGVFRFEETKPISTYLFAFAAGPFEELAAPDNAASNIRLRLFVRKSMLPRARQEWPEVARDTRRGMEKLSAFFGQPYPFPKYDQVLIPGFPYGGMEHAGATFLREDGILFRAAPNITDHQRRAVTVLHELAHQWFGDFVTMRWFDDLWLKEGFAQYMAFHTLAELEPPSEVWKRFYESIKPIAYNIDSTPGTTPIYQQVRNLADAKSAYGPIVYQKAPALLRVLNYRIGEDAFRDGVRLFLRKHRYANATWQDLIGAVSETSGKDLGPWANAWVTQRGMPVVTARWSCSGSKLAGVEIAQSDSLGEGHLWPVSTQVLLGGGRQRLKADFATAEAKVAGAAGQPCPDYVFTNAGDHAYGRFLPDSRSIAGIEADMSAVSDPLERALHWGALWDAVREAEMSPADYVDFAIRRLPGESDLDITQSILGRTNTALTRYLPEPRRGELASLYEALLMERMKHGASRDLRIAYFRAFTSAATTGPSLAELENLLAGETGIAGVPLQQRDRWNIIVTLVRQGAANGSELVARESQHDKTEDGRRSAYAALAGIATPENKRKYFEEYLKDGAVPEDFITASLSGFHAWNQTALTLEFLKPALEALPMMKRQRKIFFINGWLASFVGTETSAEAQRIVAAYLERKDLDPDLRLKVLEVKDDLDRTVRIRARWQ